MRPCPESRAHSGSGSVSCHSPNSFCWGSILEKKSWPHSLAAPLNSVAGLCVQALSSSCPLWLGCSVSRPCPPGRALGLCGWALWLGLVLLLSSSWPCTPELCGWALWPGSVSGPCPPLVLVLPAPLKSVAGLCGLAYWRGVWPNKAMSMPTKIH